MAATAAFRDEMREATRSPWQAPWASGATADRARSWQMSPVRRVSAQRLICVVARLANKMNYSLRPQLTNEA
jgi:hypothetical protein